MKNDNKEISFDNEKNNENKINIKYYENLVIDEKNYVDEKDKNKVNIIKNEEFNITTERKENLEKEMEINEEELTELSDIIFFQKIFNRKKTKIILQKDYEFIIKIINKLKEKEFELFFRYLHDIKISIFKIIVNGFIEFNFNDENKEKNIINIISRVISLCLNKNMFYFIYKKLSKYYRKRYKIDSIDSIKKFEKTFKVWKALYNPLNIKSFYENNKSFIPFFSLPNKKNNNITIIYDTKEKYHFGITIKILPLPILKVNKKNKDFFFIKFHDDKNQTFVVKYNDIFSNGNNCLSKIDEIGIIFLQHSVNAKLKPSDEVITIKNESKFYFYSISKIEILGNFVGYISSISIYNHSYDIDEQGNSKKYNIKISKDTDNKIQYKIYLNSELKEPNYQIEGINLEQIFSKKFIDLNNNNKDIMKRTKSLGTIKYYGGFESFIPIFKIFKYLINLLSI